MNHLVTFFAVCLLGLVAAASIDAGGGGSSTTKKSGGTTVKPSMKVTPKLTKGVTLPKMPSKGIHPYRLQIEKASPSWMTTPGQKAAVGKLMDQQPLTDAERQQVSDLLFSGADAGLSKEDETALSYLLLDDAARNATVTTPSTPTPNESGPLYVRVYNNTGERLKVWIQVIAPIPLPPEAKEKAAKPETLLYSLDSGKAYDLQQKGQRIQANAIRVWALSPTRSWADHRDHELHLTPRGQSKVYTLTFAK